MNSSNLPPGCSSPDGGIDHELEAAWEKAYEIADKAGLTADELLLVMEQGVKLVKVVHEEGEKAFRKGFEFGECRAENPNLFRGKFSQGEITCLLYGSLTADDVRECLGGIFVEAIVAENEKSFKFGLQEGEFSKRHEMEERDNE